jgi:outer membrane protein TolC
MARDLARERRPAPVPRGAPPQPAAPTPGPARPPRSLGDLLDLALSHDPATRATWRDARAAAAQAGARRSLYLPALDASAGVSRSRPAAQADKPAMVQGTWTAGGSITWVLLDLGARGAQVEEADRLLAAAHLGEQAAVADLVLRVQQSWLQLLAALALVDAESAARRQAEASLAAAEERQRSGLATVADVLQARTALSQIRLAQQQAEGQVLVSRGALATLVGLPPTAELDVGHLPETVAAAAAGAAVDDLLAEAAARNPDLGRARASADAAEAHARAVALAPLPVLSFQAGATHTWWFEPQHAGESNQWNYGLLLRLPTFDGVRPAYDALAAREAAAAARDRSDATAQRVALDVWTAWQGLRTAARRVETSRDLVASARASADVAGGRYREGVGSIVDLLNAQAALELALAEDVRSRTDLLVGVAQLARATGRLELPATEGTP